MNVYGLIGYPLGHSFSKKFFTDKFEKENLAGCSFELFPLKNIAMFPELIDREKELKGLSVTIPYKQSVIPFLTSLDEKAESVGAVNCVKVSGKDLKGYNTDTIGFERSFFPLLQKHHKKALVLGSGGASRAVQYVLTKMGISFLIVSQNESSREGVIRYDGIDEKMIREFPVIINCTPVGMSPNDIAQPPIPYQYLDTQNLLFDLIYAPVQTRFLQNGLQRGAAVKNGYEMLILQAEASWKIWNSI